MAPAASKRKVNAPTLPTSSVYDSPSLSQPSNSAPIAKRLWQVLELEAQAKARSLSSPSSVKATAIPSLNTVRSAHNAGKS